MSQSTETGSQKKYSLNVSLMLSKSKTIHRRLRKKKWFKNQSEKKGRFPLAEANQKTKRKKGAG